MSRIEQHFDYPKVCRVCSGPVTLAVTIDHYRARKRGYAYCGVDCREVGRRAGISAAFTGRTLPATTRAKMSVAQKARYEKPGEREKLRKGAAKRWAAA